MGCVPVHSDIPYDKYLSTLRFPRAQGDRNSTSYKFRPSDDCSGSGLNSSTGFSERMRTHGLETLLSCAHECRVAFADMGEEGEPVFAKGDREKSYRLLAIPQLAYVDDFLRVAPRLWAAAQEDAFRRILLAIGIPLKHGNGDVSQVITALGHLVGANAHWAGLHLTDQRQASLLQRLA